MREFVKSACFVLQEIMGLAIIGLVIIGANRLSAEEPLPSQDQAIARAVEKHPDIVAAKAKLALAESELNSKRMEISRQVLQSYSNLKNFEAQASATKAKLEVARHELAATNGAGKAVAAIERDRAQAAVQEQESALIQLLLQREQIEKELRLLIGNPEGPEKKIPSQASAAARQIPHGPIVNRIRSEMKNGRTSIEVPDQPLGELLQYLSDKFGIAIQIHPEISKDLVEGPIRIKVNDVPLPAAFQAIEDFNNGQIQFVVRDYGIVLMDRDSAEKKGFLSLLEFAREPTENSSEPTPQTANRAPPVFNEPRATNKPVDNDNPFK